MVQVFSPTYVSHAYLEPVDQVVLITAQSQIAANLLEGWQGWVFPIHFKTKFFSDSPPATILRHLFLILTVFRSPMSP